VATSFTGARRIHAVANNAEGVAGGVGQASRLSPSSSVWLTKRRLFTAIRIGLEKPSQTMSETGATPVLLHGYGLGTSLKHPDLVVDAFDEAKLDLCSGLQIVVIPSQ
jgi:hypothetical protein